MLNKVVLKVVNLTKEYNNRVAVNNLNFSIHAGEIFGFLGANGAGKSTTMKLITGLARATYGEIYVDKQPMSAYFTQCISKVGAMIETPYFYPYLTGYQNLKFYAKMYKNFSRTKIIEIANLVGLTTRLHEKVKNYSLGMKQRLGIAQSLLHNPKILILDEPTNGLDANGIREIKIFLRNLANKKHVAIMISSHILAIMESLCDTICIIDKGKIKEIKSIDAIKRDCHRFGSHYIKTSKPNYAGVIIQEKFNIRVGVTKNKILFNTNEYQLAKIIIILTKNKIPIYSAGEVSYSLEDAFIDVVGTSNTIT